MQDLVLDDVTKTWPNSAPAVDHLDLKIPAGELVGLVGPSGCGKTTVLRILAGLDAPTSGRVVLGTRDITQLETRQRHFGLVTQQNQLLSHLSAARNISFPLEVRDEQVTVAEIDRRLERESTQLRIGHLLEQRASTLSEGQRRLVQLARAVIGVPVALLMDEPLANVEDQVRLRLRGEIVRLHHERGLTSVLVTASQHDAMAMCDRIAMLFDGHLEQYASPAEIYAQPATVSVARFFGEPPMNIVPAQVDATGGTRQLCIWGRWSPVTMTAVDPYHGREVLVGIRPEDLLVGAPAEDGIEVHVRTTEPIGYQTLIDAATPDGRPVACVTPGRAPRPGTVFDLGLMPDRLHVFDPATGMAIHHPTG